MKKIYCIIISVLLFLSVCPLAYADNAEIPEDLCLTYRDVDFTVEHSKLTESNRNTMLNSVSALTASSTVPNKYSSVTEGRVTDAKNQGNYGTCWAFSATSAAETSMYINNGKTKDLSEMQLAGFFYRNKYDPLGNATGDATANLKSTPLKIGGNHLFTMWALAGWTNACLESDLPYSTKNCTAAESGTLSEKYSGNLAAHLQNAFILPYSTKSADIKDIKTAIMKYGSVSCSYYHVEEHYNETYCSYYTNEKSTNHAVTIVGWNDNFSKYNFNSTSSSFSWFPSSGKPVGNGAWLVKNSWDSSWGTDGDSNPTKGEAAGYFWLSYYDASLIDSGSVFVFDYYSAENYKNNYQYDGSCGISRTQITAGTKVAAIYTANGSSTGKESLDAVGIGVSSTDESGTVYIYSNPTAGKPESGILISQQSFSTNYVGYYTVKLAQPPELSEGQDFSVVFKFNTDAEIFVDSSYNNGDWIGFTANTSKDRTYSVSSAGAVTDLAKSGLTARVKAYTNEIKPTVYSVTFNANGGSNAPQSVIKTKGTDLRLPFAVPTRTGYSFLGWAYDPAATSPDFSAGDSYTVDADAELYAVWQMTAAEYVTVNPQSVTVTAGGKAKAVTLSVHPSDAPHEWFVSNADNDGSVYTYGGITIAIDGDTVLISSDNYLENPVNVYFYDRISLECAVCTVKVLKPPVESDLPDIKELLLGGGEYSAALDITCDGTIDILDFISIKLALEAKTD